MVKVYTEVGVDVDLDDFETEDLIEELKSRGENLIYVVYESLPDLDKSLDYYKRGNIKEAMIYLERAFPEFNGLSEKVNG